MLNDLLILGIPKKSVQLINVTMAGSKTTLRVDNQYTSTFPNTNGVRQGDELSAILFDLVLGAILQKMNAIGHIGTKSTQILVYADDGAIMSRNKNGLEDTLDNIEKGPRRKGLLVNENKTKYMQVSDFGGLVVGTLNSGTQDRGFGPGRSRRILRAKKSSACLPSEWT
jgi:hypothetical protein